MYIPTLFLHPYFPFGISVAPKILLSVILSVTSSDGSTASQPNPEAAKTAIPSKLSMELMLVTLASFVVL